MTKFKASKITAVALFIYALLYVFTSMGHAEQTSYTDAHVKAVYILKIRDFVEWPEGIDPDTICVIGSDLIGSSLAQIQRTPEYSYVKVEKKAVTSSFDDCHIVFISDAKGEDLGPLLFSLNSSPVLTVSDIEKFTIKGGMIEFVENDNKIRININNGNAKKSSLFISSKLLQIANKVIDP